MIKKISAKIIVILVFIFISSLIFISIVNANDSKNNDPMLKAIKINGKDIEPDFEMFTTEYIVVVDESVKQAKIQAIPDDSNAKVKILGEENLKEGKNEFEIQVTAEDGIAKQSYFVYITKGDKNKANANLKSLKVENYELAPEFKKNIINYAFEYPGNLTKVKIDAIPENENAKVDILGNENLSNKSQNIEIKVTAEDGQTIKTYYLIARKELEKTSEMEQIEDDEKQNEKIETMQTTIANEIIDNNNEIKQSKNSKVIIIIISIIIIGCLIIIAKSKRGGK